MHACDVIRGAILVALVGVVAGCDTAAPAATPPSQLSPQLRDVTVEAGLGNIHGHTLSAAWLDLDGDHRPDLVTSPPLTVRRNLGGHFAAPLILDKAFAGRQSVVAGFMTHGALPDLVVVGGHHAVVLRNLGGMKFDVGAAVAMPGAGELFGATLFDVNGDGHLDVVSTVSPPNGKDFTQGLPCKHDTVGGLTCSVAVETQPKRLLLGDGKGGLAPATKTHGLDGKGMTLAFGSAPLGSAGASALVAVNDYGWLEVYEPDGQNGLREVAAASGLKRWANGMGIDFGDVDGDGQADAFVTSAGPSLLFRGLGAGQFAESGLESGIYGLTDACVGWGTTFVDIDNDGDLDAAVACSDLDLMPHLGTARSILMLNDGAGHFSALDPALAPGLDRGASWHIVVAADVDGDGDEDLLYIPTKGRVLLLRNDLARKAANWAVEVVEASGSSVANAQVWFQAGSQRWLRGVWGPRGALTTPPYEAFFALPEGVERLDKVTVVTGDGRQVTVTNIPDSGRIHVVLPPL